MADENAEKAQEKEIDSIEELLSKASGRSNVDHMEKWLANPDNRRLLAAQAKWLKVMHEAYIAAGFEEATALYFCGRIVEAHYGGRG